MQKIELRTHKNFSLLHTIRFRLTLWYVAILAAALLVFGVFVYTIVTEYAQQSIETTMATRLNARLVHIANAYDTTTGRIPDALIQGNVWEESEDNILLLASPKGQIIEESGRLTKDNANRTVRANIEHLQDVLRHHSSEPMPALDIVNPSIQASTFNPLFSIKQDGNTYELKMAMLMDHQHQLLAVLLIGGPRENAYQVDSLLWTLLLVSPVILIVFSAGGYWLADRAMSPVRAITRTAQRICETDLHLRLNLQRQDELGELAQTFDHMLVRLEAAFDRQRQFTADASHELRTPLSILNIEAERSLRYAHTAQEYEQAMKVIQQESQIMAHLVNDLLTLARSDSMQSIIQEEQVDLTDTVADAVEQLIPLAQHYAMSIILEPSAHECIVAGDPRYLHQLFRNVIENALKYSAGIGTRVDINMIYQHRHYSQGINVRVRDDGPGIAKEHLSHVFDRFYRADGARKHNTIKAQDAQPKSSGSGLGLSIARWIVQAHKGSIDMESEPGQGTVVDIWLPLVADQNLD